MEKPEKKILRKIFRYYESYMKFSREHLEIFARHDELNIDIEGATKKELALELAYNKYNEEDHYAK